MAHIEKKYTKKGKTRYKAIIEVGDSEKRQRKTETFSRKKDAEKWLNERMYSRNIGFKIKKSKITVSEQLDKWLQEKKVTRRATTYDRYKYKVNSHLKPFFGDKPLQELEPWHIEDYLTIKRAKGRKDGKGGLSENTLKKHYVILNNMLKKAVKLKIIRTNPMDPIECPVPKHYKAPVMTKEESKILLEEAKDNDLMYSLIYTLLLTGMRRGEALGLEWNNINFKESYLDIKQSYLPLSHGTIHDDDVKKLKSFRRLKMYSGLNEKLKQVRIKQNEFRLKYGKEYNESRNYVFCSPTGHQYNPNTYHKKFKKIIKKAGLDSNYSIHTLRHTFATRLLENDTNIKVVKMLLGHSSITTTEKYSHANIKLQDRPIKKLGKALNF